MYRTDLQLKQDVEAELAWDPRIDASRIGVAVEGGAVSLLGIVRTYPEKLAAEEATRRVAGVRAISEQLEVKIVAAHPETDAEIARAAARALRGDSWVPAGVIATVEAGHVRLTGQVAWHFERTHAVTAIEQLRGIVGVTNDIVLTECPQDPAAATTALHAALARHATPSAPALHAHVSPGAVTLSGQASSWARIEHAVSAAWAIPGVAEVVDAVSRTGI